MAEHAPTVAWADCPGDLAARAADDALRSFRLERMMAGALAVLTALVGLLWAEPSAAHASLVSTDPLSGVILDEPPPRFVVTFTEPVSASVLRLIGPDGSVTPLTSQLEGNALVVFPPPEMAQGTHVFSWRVVSIDAHPINGAVMFSVGSVTEGVVPTEPSTDRVVETGLWLTRLGVYLALFMGVGGSFFLAWISPADDRDALAQGTIQRLLALGIFAAPPALAFQGLDLLGEGVGPSLFGPAWQAGLFSGYGTTIVVALAALILAMAALRVSQVSAARALSALALLMVGASLALSGHASNAPPRPLGSLAVFVHASTVAFWVGALLPLAVLLRRDRPSASTVALNRFSREIPFAIAPLLVAGGLLAYLQLTSWSDFWTTSYGRVLSLKLTAVGGLFIFAAANRFRHRTKAVWSRNGTAALTRSITAEIFLVVVVLGLVGLWRFTPPPRALAAEATMVPAEARLDNGRTVADLTIVPGTSGLAEVRIVLSRPGGEPITAEELILEISNPEAGLDQISWPASLQEDGSWKASGIPIPVPGEWLVHLDIGVSALFRMSLTDIVQLREAGAMPVGPTIPAPVEMQIPLGR